MNENMPEFLKNFILISFYKIKEMEQQSNSTFKFEVHWNQHVLRYEYDDSMCKLLPNWTQNIKDCHMIQIQNVDDFVGIIEFFEGIRTNHIKLTKDNFQSCQRYQVFD